MPSRIAPKQKTDEKELKKTIKKLFYEILDSDNSTFNQCNMIARGRPAAGKTLYGLKTALSKTRWKVPETTEMIAMIKKGLPFSEFEKISKNIGISSEVLAALINIAPRTLARRKAAGRFERHESENLMRIGILFERAVDVLEGAENAREWLKSPKKALGGKTPLEYSDTEPGAREVDDLLGRLEHGVFS